MNEPIIYAHNLFRGVNPHLQSILQTPSSGAEDVDDSMVWPSFHSDHVTYISGALNQVLPARYVARTEKALQIRVDEFPPSVKKKRKPEPDVAIFERSVFRPRPGVVSLTPAIATWDKPLESTLDFSEDFIPSVVVRDMQDHKRIGRAIARIELLSPTNKPGYTGYHTYRQARIDAIYSGTTLIEVDYIHELPPPLLDVPEYPDDPDSHAYSIYVSNPHPSTKDGRLKAYTFDVDSPFPIIEIPLLEGETLAFDFGAVYQFTYESGRWGDMVDYRLLPERFETYSPADQARIEARMAAIAQMQTAEDS